MITKTTKVLLFAALIAAMILPFSGMLMAEAAPNENASDKAKDIDRSTREAPEPHRPGDVSIPIQTDPNEVKDIPGPEYPKRSEGAMAMAHRGTSIQAGSGHEAFGTDLDVNPTNLSGVYAKMEVHTGLNVKADTFLFAPTMKGPGNSPLEITTAYDNVGGSNEKQRVVLYNFNDDEYDWTNAKVINQDFLDDYTVTSDGNDYYYGQIWYDALGQEWKAEIYNYDTSSWEEIGTDPDDYSTIAEGWVAWEEHDMDGWFNVNCPTTLPQIDAEYIKVYTGSAWPSATSTYASVMDTGSICGVTGASFNTNYSDWEVDD